MLSRPQVAMYHGFCIAQGRYLHPALQHFQFSNVQMGVRTRNSPLLATSEDVPGRCSAHALCPSCSRPCIWLPRQSGAQLVQAPLFTFDKLSNTDTHCVLMPDFTFGSGGWPLARMPIWDDVRCDMMAEDAISEEIVLLPNVLIYMQGHYGHGG